jgi:DNA invertase Pin-like site-specific DNA recombinase
VTQEDTLQTRIRVRAPTPLLDWAAEGKYKGRAPTARAKAPEIRGLHAQGVGPTEIARRLGISRASVYRALP